MQSALLSERWQSWQSLLASRSDAGQAKGGDRRWGNLQSAAIKIADPNDPGRGGDYIALAIEVGEHPERRLTLAL